MATLNASLTNMSIATDGAGSNQGLLMPKLQFRFRALFLNFGVAGGATQELTKQVGSYINTILIFIKHDELSFS